MKPLDLEDGAIIVVGSKQVQVLDLVTEPITTKVEKCTVTPCSIPPRKRPRLCVDISFPEALIMPKPDVDHQVNKLE